MFTSLLTETYFGSCRTKDATEPRSDNILHINEDHQVAVGESTESVQKGMFSIHTVNPWYLSIAVIVYKSMI